MNEMATERLYLDATPPNEFSPRGAWVHDLVEMGLLVQVKPVFYVSFGHRPRCDCQIDSCLIELRMVPDGE